MTDAKCSFFELIVGLLLKKKKKEKRKLFKIHPEEFGNVLVVKLYANKSNPALKSGDSLKTGLQEQMTDHQTPRFSLLKSIRPHYLALISSIKIEKKKIETQSTMSTNDCTPKHTVMRICCCKYNLLKISRLLSHADM